MLSKYVRVCVILENMWWHCRPISRLKNKTKRQPLFLKKKLHILKLVKKRKSSPSRAWLRGICYNVPLICPCNRLSCHGVEIIINYVWNIMINHRNCHNPWSWQHGSNAIRWESEYLLSIINYTLNWND